MLGFDALGRLALGQGADQAASTVVLVANPGTYNVIGNALVFQGSLAVVPGNYVVTGNATVGKSSLLASAGAYVLAGGGSMLPGKMVAAPGGYVITGQPSNLPGRMVASAGSYAVTASASPLIPSLKADRGTYSIIGSGNLAPIVMVAASGAYTLTLGDYVLTRTGGDYDQVYGGIGHYLEELERLRRLAAITRPTPRPIVREMRPNLRPLSPLHLPPAPRAMAAMATPDRQATHLPDIAAQRLAAHVAQQQAAIARRRRQEAEILLLVS